MILRSTFIIGLFAIFITVHALDETSSTSTSSTTSTSTSTSSTTTTTSTTKKPLTPVPKVLTDDGDLHVIIPAQKELFFSFEHEDETDAHVVTFSGLKSETNQYSDDRLVDAKIYADKLDNDMMKIVSKLGEDAAMDEDVDAVQDDLDLTKSNLNDLTTHVDKVEQDGIDALKKLSDDTTTAMNQLNADIATNKKSIQTVEQNAETARNNLENSLQTSITDASNSWTTKLNNAKTDLTSDIASLRNTLTQKINTDVAGVQGQVDSLKTLTNQHTNTINNLTPRMKTAEDKISNLQGTTQTLNGNINTNKAKAEAAQTTANQAKTSAATANTNIDKVSDFLNKAMCGTLTYTAVNSDSGMCEAANNPLVTKYLTDSRAGTQNKWVALGGGRAATYKKQGSYADSVVLFHYQDSLGLHSDRTSSYPSCIWRIVVGNTVVSSLSSHDSSATGWDIFPGRMTFPLELSAGSHSFRIEVHKRYYSSCLAGWANNQQENHMMFEEIHRDRIGFVTSLGDRRITSRGSWFNIPNRELQYLKKDGDTDLHLFWTDVMGYNQRSSSTHSCHVRMLMSGPGFSNVHLGINGAYSNGAWGWKIRPRSLQYYIPKKNLNLQPGIYTFTAQYVLDSYGGASECLQGWEAQLNNMVVVEKDPSRMAFAPSNLFSGTSKQSLPDRRHFGGYATILGRTVSHTKRTTSSVIRVTYMDSLGWRRRTGTTACYFRLLVDGSPSGRVIWTHTNNYGSTWNIDPYSIVWLPTVSKGTHSYAIQMQRNDGAHECLAGWSPYSEPTNNFLLVEEVETVKTPIL